MADFTPSYQLGRRRNPRANDVRVNDISLRLFPALQKYLYEHRFPGHASVLDRGLSVDINILVLVIVEPMGGYRYVYYIEPHVDFD